MFDHDYDLVVVGAGPGGYVAAIRARQLGLKTAVVEKDRPGGVCLNVGCIPSKALIHQADIFRSAAALEDLGVRVDRSGFDYRRVFKKSRAAAERLSKGVQFLLKKNGVEYIAGTARLASAREVVVDGKTLTTRNVLLATGSRPRSIPGFDIDEKTVLSSTGALMMEELPKRFVILGAGAIGMEFAHIMNSFGVEVTVVEMLDRVLPLEDAETVAVVVKEFSRRGIRLLTATKAAGLKKTSSGLEVKLAAKDGSEQTLEADKVLVAVGRAPNTEDLGLEKIGVGLERGFVRTGDWFETAVSGVYAIGDLIPTAQLAHLASKEGEIAVERMAGMNPPKGVPPDEVPSAVYCEPQVGGFGLTEEEAVRRGLVFAKAVFPYRGVGKAVATESVEGIVKILFHPETREILAAHVAGSQATELIHELLLAKRSELLLEDVADMIHAHPTLSEGVMEAARLAEGRPVHI